MPLTPGTRLGVYDITAPLGEGGMGQVWRATDTSLGRQVAIKILPGAFATDPERLARFEREAKTLASLNHPHIAAIYAVEKSTGTLALVMELVEGDDLSQRIARGPIPLDEALPIAKQIAEALEAAHEQGIVHRDLKPANIKVRPDGMVKVLDFGLAKALDARPASATTDNAPTITSPAQMTGVGVILGTAAYMAPEQARGKAVDRRADIWAFGAVLFEMLTGTRPFHGEDVTDTIMSVLSKEPDFAALPATVPARVTQALRVCLRKDPKQRAQAIGDVRLALEGAFETAAPPPTASASAVRPLWRRALPVAAAVALTAALAVLVAAWQWRPASTGAPAEPLRASLLFPDGSGPSDGGLALSPDGSRLAFVTLASLDGQRIWIRPMAGGDDRPLSGTEGAADPAWSHDGTRIAFRVDNREIRVVPADGGPVVPVASNPLALGMPTWDADGGILFYAGDSVWKVSERGGPPSVLVKVGGEGFHAASTRVESLPNGGGLLIGGRNTAGKGGGSGIFAVDVGTGESAPLVELAQQPHFVDGWLLFGVGQSAATVFAQRFDVDSRALRGPPIAVANGVAKPGGHTQLAVSRHTLVYSPASDGSLDRDGRDLLWLDSAGKLTPAVPGGFGGWMRDLSPDGTTIASGGFGLTVVGTQGGLPRRLEGAGSAVARYPRWSRDGKTLLFASGDLRSITTTPGDTSKLLVPQPEAGEFLSVGWGPSGEVLFVQRLPDGKSELRALDASGTTRTVQPGGEDASLSPDGSWLAYVSAQGSRRPPEVFVRAYPGTAEVRVSMDGGLRPTWGPDGRALYFLTRRGKAQRVVLSFAGGSITASTPSDLAVDLPSLDLAAAHPDGRILLHSRVQATDSLTLIRDWQALVREGR